MSEMWLEWHLDADPRLPDMEALRALLARAAEAVVGLEFLLPGQHQAPGKYQACVVLTDDAGIRELNRRTRGVDAATDVLSFPLVSFPRGTARDHPARLRALLDPDTGRRHLGDIVISAERAQAQAERFGHSARREMAYLLTHGMCHLLGYDHQGEADTARMRALEERALTLVGALRGQDAPDENEPDENKRRKGESAMRDQDQRLLDSARAAMRSAYAPYSNYAVGACLLAEDGRAFTGCNVENASFGATICAERTALVKAVSEGARRFSAIAIAAAGSAPYPCGMCRQALNEFAPGLRVLVTWGDQVRETTLDALLPNGFGPASLGGEA